MEKWICKECGYVYYGDEAPEHCSQCGAPKTKFYREGSSNGCGFKTLFFILVMTIAVFSIFSCSSTLTVDNTTVENVDLNRYMGKWYEIARFDHSFERNMELCTALYSLRQDGTIKVINRGLKNGKWKTSEGTGIVTDQPGVLRVSFFGPFYSDYRVMMLAPDYSYVLVGGSSDDYLWILSRTPQLEKDTLDQIIHEAIRRGYKTDELVWVNQQGAL